MRTVGIGIVTALALVAAPAWAKRKPKTKAKPDQVVLVFGWAEGLAADVSYQRSRAKKGTPTRNLSRTARLTVATEGKTLRVAYRDWKQSSTGGAAAVTELQIMNKMTTIVDKKGDFVRIDGTIPPDEALRVAAGSGYKPTTGADTTKQLAQAIPVLAQKDLERTWQMLVGSWAGAEMEIGAEYETTDEAPVPLLPGTSLKATNRFGAERRFDCPRNPARKCVELWLRHEPDGESLKKVAEKLAAKFGALGLGDLGDFGVVEEITLVTEPDRLIPHRLEITKTLGPSKASQTDPEPARLVDRTTWTFAYP